MKNDFAYPTACTIRLSFAARGDDPELNRPGNDGGMTPRLPRELKRQHVEVPPEGILFVGEEGTILGEVRRIESAAVYRRTLPAARGG